MEKQMPVTKLGTAVRLQLGFEQAVARVTEALQAEGFGVLTEIDVKETLKKKLGVEHSPYRILGACNPPMAHRALTIAPEIGLLLPCNVVVRQLAEGTVEVSIIDPIGMLALVDRQELREVAQEAKDRLERVAAALSD